MKIYFSPANGGFYSDRIHGDNLPDDAVEISPDLHQTLLAGQASGLRIVAGVGGAPILQSPEDAPLEELRARKIAEIEQARDTAIVGGFEFNGTRFDSDAKSIQRINGAVTLSLLNPDYETPWITQLNTIVQLDAAALAGLGIAAGLHEATQVFKARGLKDAALSASTKEALAAISW